MLVRLSVITCALLFGIPAGALLLGHMGFIAIPADAYVSSVSVSEDSPGYEPYALERAAKALAGPVPSARRDAARAAIVAANGLLPHYDPELNRPWVFRESIRAHDVGATMTVCRDCPSGRRTLFVGATTNRIHNNLATVTIRWSLHRTQRILNRQGEMLSPGSVEERGEFVMFLEISRGRWRVIEPE